MSGFFVAFEGGDGAGKSTQVGLLRDALAAAGCRVQVTRQPGGTPLGAEIRDMVLAHGRCDVGARAEALLIAADKAQHVDEVVAPALADHRIVITDRYVDSMLAYQGAGRGMEVGALDALARWAVGGVMPDLTVLLDVDPSQAVLGIKVPDRLESAGDGFHTRVRDGFLALAQASPERYLVVNARLERGVIARQVLDRVWARLPQDCQPGAAH